MSHILCGDCRSLMTQLPPESVDLVITDPPFGIKFKAVRANYNRDPGLVLDGYVEVCDNYSQFTMSWMSRAYCALKQTGAMFVFSSWNNLEPVLAAASELGLTQVNHIIWKYQFGVVTKKKFVSSHYHLLYLAKSSERKFFRNSRFQTGKARYADMEDVWVIPREYWRGEKKTPTKLPSEIVRKILSYASEPGDVILDPFLGSGQVAVVAKEMGREYIGYELVPEYFDFAARRLDELAV